MKRTPKDVAETDQQAKVKALICRGLTNKEIAAKLGLSVSGAKYHVANILKSWNVKSRAKLVAKLRGLS